MPVYKCELCNFETKIKPHFNRHIGTAKHKKKYLNSKSHELSESKEEKNSDQLVSTQELDNTEIKETQSENILSKTEFECEMCGRIFS